MNVGLRKALDLYANLRPVRNIAGVPSRFQGVDLVIVRENTEDLYSGLEHEIVPGVVESLKIITETASTRIARVRVRARACERPQARDGDPQGQHHEARRRPVPRLHAATCRASTPTSATTSRSSTPRACSWSWTRRSSTCCCCRTSTATSCRICAPGWSAGWASCPARTSGRDLRGLRGRPRQRAGHRGQEPREPDGAAAVGPDDARPHRRARRRATASAPRSAASSSAGQVRTRDLGGKRRRRSSPRRYAGKLRTVERCQRSRGPRCLKCLGCRWAGGLVPWCFCEQSHEQRTPAQGTSAHGTLSTSGTRAP